MADDDPVGRGGCDLKIAGPVAEDHDLVADADQRAGTGAFAPPDFAASRRPCRSGMSRRSRTENRCDRAWVRSHPTTGSTATLRAPRTRRPSARPGAASTLPSCSAADGRRRAGARCWRPRWCRPGRAGSTAGPLPRSRSAISSSSSAARAPAGSCGGQGGR
jgi:hypothetical protein